MTLNSFGIHYNSDDVNSANVKFTLWINIEFILNQDDVQQSSSSAILSVLNVSYLVLVCSSNQQASVNIKALHVVSPLTAYKGSTVFLYFLT